VPPASLRRLATIDLGSNTVRYLLVEVDGAGWRALDQDQRVTRLGQGLAAAGRLGEAPMERAAAAVVEYAERARRLGAEVVRIVATSAVREAVNGRDFAAALEGAAAARVSIVSGDDEARLTVRGVLAGLRDLAPPLLVFDIGGGSTEYILARGDAAAAAVSLRLGVVDLTERHPFPERVEPARFRALLAEVAGRLAAGVPEPIRTARVGRLVGTAGTATTLAALDLGLALYDPARVQGYTLTRGAIQAQLDRLGALTVVERAALPCLEPGRADLIVPGLAIVLATLDLVGIDQMVVSDWGLREGILISLCS
jgi:exopolyphosphatase/guanosine-5'-triphosphate,3'-diphosphate pyrophosphatase